MKSADYHIHDQNLPWGHLVAILVDGVLCLGWIDNNVVLAFTTIHIVNSSTDSVERLRRRPAGKASHILAVRKAFGNKSQAEMNIPRMINDYNYNMNGINIADQQRSNYMTQRKALPFFYWILDHACINVFTVGCLMKFFFQKAIMRNSVNFSFKIF